MYTLFIANKNYSSWSLRPWVLMKEAAIPFTEISRPFSEGSNWSEFRKFSPSGLVPCLETAQFAVWDSLAIAEYLADNHQGIWPQDPFARAWARCASAEMHSGFSALRNQCSMSCGLRVKLHELPMSLQKDISRIDELWCEGLKRFNGPFLAGAQFTAVDAFFAPVAFRIQSYGLQLSDMALQYAKHLLSLSSMQLWYQEALQETWREQAHEEHVLNFGVILEDLRVS